VPGRVVRGLVFFELRLGRSWLSFNILWFLVLGDELVFGQRRARPMLRALERRNRVVARGAADVRIAPERFRSAYGFLLRLRKTAVAAARTTPSVTSFVRDHF
jgi:hypothetical protein